MTGGMTAVIPAHNEEASIGATIRSIKANGITRVIAVLDKWAPPDPHEPGEDCPDCEVLHHARQAIADALGAKGNGKQ